LFLKKVDDLLLFKAHRTLPVERTVLLYCIKQALRSKKASFFSVKNLLNQRLGNGRLPPGYALITSSETLAANEL